MFPLDELDRKIAACLQADGRASWTAIAEQCGSSVATVSRRGQRLLTNRTVRVAVVPPVTRTGPSSTFRLRIGCRAGAQGEVVARLADHPDIRFLALVAGRYDIMAELAAHTEGSLFSQLITDIQTVDGVRWCESDLILHEYKAAQDWSWQLLARTDTAPEVQVPHECDPGHLDDVDRTIAEVMRTNGRIAFSAVAAQIGIDETTVRRRFETAISRGCLRVITLVPAAALGFTSEVLLDVAVEPARLQPVSAELAQLPGARFIAATLSGSSLICEVIERTPHDLFDFLTGTLATLDGVRGWEASLELLTVKRGFVETPWWRDELPAAQARLDTSGPAGEPRDNTGQAPIRRR